MRYKTENQILAQSLAPRTPYLLTIRDCEMSVVFISSVATPPSKLLYRTVAGYLGSHIDVVFQADHFVNKGLCTFLR